MLRIHVRRLAMSTPSGVVALCGPCGLASWPAVADVLPLYDATMAALPALPGGALRRSPTLRMPTDTPSEPTESPPAPTPPTLPSQLPRVADGTCVPLNIGGLWDRGAAQRQRFTDQFKVYDTEQRHSIRNKLWARARQNLSKAQAAGKGFRERAEAIVTGVGGNGKSFNVALFVAQARAAGAAVVYVHDMQTWLHDITLIIREIHFAAARRGISLDTLPMLQDAMAILSAAGDPQSLSIERYKVAEEKEISLREKLKSTDRVTLLVRELRDQCTELGAPLIVVIDQDNRLSRLKGEDDGLYTTYNRMILTMAPHLLIVGGSANNEGWARRDWKDALEIHHYPEPVPDAVLQMLFPAVWADAGLRQMLKGDFDMFPLMVAMAEDMMRRVALKRTLSSDITSSIKKALTGRIEDRVRHYIDSRGGHFAQLTASVFEFMDRDVCVLSRSIPYDRNYMYLWTEGDGAGTDASELQDAMPEAANSLEPMYLRSVFKAAADKEKALLRKEIQRDFLSEIDKLGNGARLEIFFGEAAPLLFRPVGKALEEIHLTRAYLCASDFPKGFWGSDREDMILFRNCPRGQYFDYMTVRKWGDVKRGRLRATMTFFQLTVNDTHSASDVTCAAKQERYLRYQSTLTQCVQALREGASREGVTVAVESLFVYMTPRPSLKLTSGETTLTWACGPRWRYDSESEPPGWVLRDGDTTPGGRDCPREGPSAGAFALLFSQYHRLVLWVRERPKSHSRDQSSTTAMSGGTPAPPSSFDAVLAMGVDLRELYALALQEQRDKKKEQGELEGAQGSGGIEKQEESEHGE